MFSTYQYYYSFNVVDLMTHEGHIHINLSLPLSIGLQTLNLSVVSLSNQGTFSYMLCIFLSPTTFRCHVY